MAQMVKVRIAVTVNPDGNWSANGYKGAIDKDVVEMTRDTLEPELPNETTYFIEAEVPLPVFQTLPGKVVP